MRYDRETLSGAAVVDGQWDSDKYPEKDLTYRIIGSIIAVHKTLGAGYLESIYENALMIELKKNGLNAERQRIAKVCYDGIEVGEHRADIVVEGKVVLELKSVEESHPRHIAQIISTMKAFGMKIGLLVNFNEAAVVKGIQRIVF